MDPFETQFPDSIDEQVGLLLNSADEGVLGSYVIVAEIIYPSHIQLQVTVSSGVAPWTAIGMLSQALDEVGTAAHFGSYHKDDED